MVEAFGISLQELGGYIGLGAGAVIGLSASAKAGIRACRWLFRAAPVSQEAAAVLDKLDESSTSWTLDGEGICAPLYGLRVFPTTSIVKSGGIDVQRLFTHSELRRICTTAAKLREAIQDRLAREALICGSVCQSRTCVGPKS